MRESRFRRPRGPSLAVDDWRSRIAPRVMVGRPGGSSQNRDPAPTRRDDLHGGRPGLRHESSGWDRCGGASDGKTLWSTKAAAKPLGVAGDQTVIGQAEPTAVERRRSWCVKAQDGTPLLTTEKPLNAARRDPLGRYDAERRIHRLRRTGRARRQGVLALPPDPEAWSPRGHGGTGPAPQMKRGFPSGTVERTQPPREQPAAISRGPPVPFPRKVRVGPCWITERERPSTSIRGLQPSDRRQRQLPRPPASDRIPGFPGLQFASADGRDIMGSKRMGDDRIWDKYTLTVYDRAGKSRVGEFRSHVAMAPFVVTDHRIPSRPEPILGGPRKVWSRRRTNFGQLTSRPARSCGIIRFATPLWEGHCLLDRPGKRGCSLPRNGV